MSAKTSRAKNMIAEPQKAFAHLHKELVEYQVRFIETSGKIAGMGLLMIGWILTSESARSFIRGSSVGRWAVVAGVGMITLAYLLVAFRMIQVMQHLGSELKTLDYFPLSYYQFRVMPLRAAIATATLGVTPAAIAVALVLFAIK